MLFTLLYYTINLANKLQPNAKTNELSFQRTIFGGQGVIRTHEAEASDLQSDGFSHLPTCPQMVDP